MFEDKDLTNMRNRELRPIRKDMQIVFQDPYGSLNATMNVQQLLEEPLIVQTNLSKKSARNSWMKC